MKCNLDYCVLVDLKLMIKGSFIRFIIAGKTSSPPTSEWQVRKVTYITKHNFNEIGIDRPDDVFGYDCLYDSVDIIEVFDIDEIQYRLMSE